VGGNWLPQPNGSNCKPFKRKNGSLSTFAKTDETKAPTKSSAGAELISGEYSQGG